jgi:hypothetical protein
MNVLIGCEFSGVMREAFRARGHNAYSNDLLPAADNSPFHIPGDVFDALSLSLSLSLWKRVGYGNIPSAMYLFVLLGTALE